jgi:DNA-binding transcriptional ArsR family regulator
MILCRLVVAGEMSAGAIVKAAGLAQSAVSQHLAKLRDDKLVATRRDAQTIYYRIADPNAARIIATLKDIYCRDA